VARFGFCGGSYTLQSKNIDAEQAINLYCEQPESTGAKTSIALLHTPGLVVKYILPEASISDLFTVNGRSFVAASRFYELLANGQFTNWGELNGPPLSPTQIFDCQTHLLILSNGDLFIFVLTAFTDSNGELHPANSFFAVEMAQFNGPVLQIDFVDGYFVATIQNSNTFQISNLEDGTTWSGLFISTISYFPDNIVSMKVDHREIWFFSARKSIGYYNVTAGFPPFIPIQGAYLEDGAAATFATTQANNTLCWIAQDERGTGVAKIMGSYVGQRISTFAVEFAWQSYPTIADAIGYAYQDQGHIFWVLRFPTANKTWVYDFATSLWHERGFWVAQSGTYIAHRSTSHTFNFGMHLVGDWKSGNIYQMSIDYCTDFGNMIRRVRRSPTISKEKKWIYFPSIEFDIEEGLGASALDIALWTEVYGSPPMTDGDGQARPAQVILAWSDDAAKTWSNQYTLDCGRVGEYNKRTRKTQLGRARSRVFELVITDPFPVRIADAYLEATCEGQPIYAASERISENIRKVT
jgi:hypothetical protein